MQNVYKLCDFGWAAICNERRKTYCGTFDYVAPEIL
jgi:serine/threonine protein kinase